MDQERFLMMSTPHGLLGSRWVPSIRKRKATNPQPDAPLGSRPPDSPRPDLKGKLLLEGNVNNCQVQRLVLGKTHRGPTIPLWATGHFNFLDLETVVLASVDIAQASPACMCLRNQNDGRLKL